MNELAQGPYSREDVAAALHGTDGTRNLSFRYERLSGNNVVLGELRNIQQASVGYNSLADIKRTARFEIAADEAVNYLHDRIRPWAQLRMPDGGLVEWPLGVFLLSTPSRQLVDGAQTTREVDGYDQLQVYLEDKLLTRFVAQPGIRYTNLIKQLIGASQTSTITSWGDPVWGFGRPFPSISDLNGSLSTTPADHPYGTALPAIQDSGRKIFFDGTTSRAISTPLIEGVSNYTISWRMDLTSWSTTGLGAPDFGIQVGSGIQGQQFLLSLAYWAAGDLRVNLLGTEYLANQTYHNGGNFAFLDWQAYKYHRIRVQAGWFYYDASLNGKSWTTIEAAPTRGPASKYTGQLGAPPPGELLASEHGLDSNVQIRFIGETGAVGTMSNLSISLGAPVTGIVSSTKTVTTPIDWAPGTPVLTVINDLLGALNYESLHFDAYGRARARPYVAPGDRSIEYVYATDELSVISGDITQTLDLFDTPNVWSCVVSKPEEPPIVAVYENYNPASPTSIVSRGRRIVQFRELTDAPDTGTLADLAYRLAAEASQVYEVVDFETAIMPIHSHADCYQLEIDGLDLDEKFIEQVWEMPLDAGGVMKHRARRSVRI